MLTATCPSREILLQYSSGKLAGEHSDELARHLESCPDCQATIMTLEDADDTLIDRLRTPLASESLLAEPEFQAAVDRAIAMPGAKPTEEAASADAKLTPAMPEMLGEYRVLDELGHGGMGRVYRALHTKLDRVVAIKVLSGGRMEDRQAITRFEREMKAIGQLDHPNLVRAHDAREIDGTPVLIMEYVDGLDLAEIVRRIGPLPVADACELIRQAALGLQRAHEHGLVHRDIKPSNIMLTVGQAASLPVVGQEGQRRQAPARTDGQAGSLPSEPAVKLLDLGLARFYAESPSGDEMTDTGQAMGTADYMAPEQASDSRTVDIRADIYSLGCTLYKLLSGRAPFSGPEYRGNLDKMNAHVSKSVPPIREFVPEIPEELTAILDRMLAKAPADRFATPAEVAEALEPFCSGANLAELAARGLAEDPLSSRESVSGREEQVEVPGPTPAPIRRRSTIKTVLLGVAFLGAMAAAFAAGVVITIKKNGQTYQVQVPENSKTVVDQDGNATVNIEEGSDGKKASAASSVTDLTALQGHWKVVRVEKGKTANVSWSGILDLATEGVPADALGNPETVDRLEFGEKELRVFGKRVGYPSPLAYRIDPIAAPKAIDLFQQPVRGITPCAVGIYEMDGDRLKICLARHFPSLKGGQRPKSFAIDPASGNILFFLQRKGEQSAPSASTKQQAETPRLEVYHVVGISPDLALRVLQAVLAGSPDVRLTLDAKTGNLVVMARPAQHAVVREVLDRIRSGPENAPAKPPAAMKPPAKLRFNFRYQPWKDVLEWLAQAADLSLVMDYPPGGTFNYSDSREYTPAEAIDLANSVLLTKGHTLVRRERILMVINLRELSQPEAIPRVSLDTLDTKSEFDFVSVLFTLEKADPAKAADAVRPLLGPHGRLAPVPETRQLNVMDTAGRVRQIRDALKRLEASKGGDARLVAPAQVGSLLPGEAKPAGVARPERSDGRGGSREAPATPFAQPQDLSPGARSSGTLLRFGPVIEQVINSLGEGKGSEGLDLVGGRLVDMPKEYGQWSAEKQRQWSAERNVDLVLDRIAGTVSNADFLGLNKPLALVPLGLKLGTLTNVQWETASGEALQTALARPMHGWVVYGGMPAPSVVTLIEREGVSYWVPFGGSSTFAFQTRKGELGLLQVVRYTEDSRGMRIRYKVAQPTAAPGPLLPQRSPPGVPGPSGKNQQPETAQKAGDGWIGLMFDHTSHDFGSVAREANLEHRFVIANKFAEEVHIKSISSSFPAGFSVQADRQTLRTFETAEILVTVDTRRFVGKRSATITADFDRPFQGQIQLQVTADIRDVPGPASATAKPPPTVPVSRPVVRQLDRHGDFTGRIEAAQTVEIRSRVGGPLMKVLFKAGAIVKQGDLLFEIDPRPLLAEVDKRQAEVALSHTRLDSARREILTRSLPAADRQRIEAQRAEAEAALKVAQGGLELAKLNLEATRLTAPIAGTISRPLVAAGNLVVAGTMPLATINSVDPMAVSFDVDERTILEIRRAQAGKGDGGLGLPLLVQLPDEKGFPRQTKVESADNRIDPKTGTTRWRALLPNPDGILMPGMFARVRLVTSPPRKTLLVPYSAIGRAIGDEQGQGFVFVVTDQNVIQRRAVKIGSRDDDRMWIVEEGLTENEWGLERTTGVQPGMVVSPQKAGGAERPARSDGRDEVPLRGDAPKK